MLLTSVLESRSHLAGHVGEGLIHRLGESLVHGLSGLIVTEETQTVLRLIHHLVNQHLIYHYHHRYHIYGTSRNLNTPVVISANEEQSLARGGIIEGRIHFLYGLGETKAGKRFRIATYNIISTESPNFTTWI